MKMYLCLTTLAALVVVQAENWYPVKDEIRFEGYWGSWGPMQICHRTIANKFSVRVEKNQGGGDDSALNSVCITCANNIKYCSSLGFWGSWYSSNTCSNGFSAASFRLEGKQGSNSDDTGGNTVKLRCNGHDMIANGAPDYWGTWYQHSCRKNTRICGIQTRVEGKQGSAAWQDDAALNGLRFVCCAKVVRVEAFLSPIYEGYGGSGTKGYYKLTKRIKTGVSKTTQVDQKESIEVATHVGVEVSYKAVTADASIDVTFFKETFKSTVTNVHEEREETREFQIYYDQPLFIYQARSMIVLSDGSVISQGNDHIVQRNIKMATKHFILLDKKM